jgi:hypothetical protein
MTCTPGPDRDGRKGQLCARRYAEMMVSLNCAAARWHAKHTKSTRATMTKSQFARSVLDAHTSGHFTENSTAIPRTSNKAQAGPARSDGQSRRRRVPASHREAPHDDHPNQRLQNGSCEPERLLTKLHTATVRKARGVADLYRTARSRELLTLMQC